MFSTLLPGRVELSGKYSAKWQLLSTKIICSHVPTTAYGQNAFRNQQMKWHHQITWNLCEVTDKIIRSIWRQINSSINGIVNIIWLSCLYCRYLEPNKATLLSVILSGLLLFYSIHSCWFILHKIWVEKVVILVAQLHIQSLLQFSLTIMSYFQLIT